MSNNIVKLGEIATLIRGITYKPNDICTKNSDNAVACMRTKNIQTELDKDDIVWIPKSIIKNSSKFLQPEDILVSSANSWNLVGKACWVPPLKFTASAGGFISILRGDPSKVNKRYLFYWFTSNKTQIILRSFSNKTTNISNLDHKRTLNLEIILPPLNEQRQIAKTLDTLSSIEVNINKKNTLIEDLENSFFKNDFEQDIYSGTKEKVTIMDLVKDPKRSIRTGPFGSQLLKSEFKDSGVTVLGIDNAVENQFKRTNKRFISIEKYKSLSRFKVNPGDVLITIMGTCGRVCVVPEDIGIAINTKHLCAITLDQNLCLPEFLRAYFLYSEISKTHIKVHTKGAIMDGLNMGIIKSLPIELPSIENQRRFVEKIIFKKRLKEKLDKKFDKFKELKGSISKKLLGV